MEEFQIHKGKADLLLALNEIDTAGCLGENVNIVMGIEESLALNDEAYYIKIDANTIEVKGGGSAGILYGSQEAVDIILSENNLPAQFEYSDAPVMKWRGISLQLMKLGKYNYAITPEEFPFFYDKAMWKEFLDFMMAQRFNYIILWNGHPFDYFVKFDRFPEAQEGMSDEQIRQNHDMLKWLISEGEKRNIKFFFEFYNIHTSVYYEKAHQLPEQISVPTSELEEYTKYSISKFVSEFPEVGLFVTPGEGLEREHSADWINHVIFEAVKSSGYSPTIFMRAWFFDLEHARKIVDNYPDLHFIRKFNVEMIADRRVDPENAEWATLNGNFLVNVHLAANLEPFRWNPPSYIREIVENNIASGATGIHLHPRKAWRWPYGSEKGQQSYQWSRDTLFFTAWSRYAWNPDRNEKDDQKYWIDLLSHRYGNQQAAKHLLKSFESGADVLPALQRLIWLGDSNHSIVTAGGTLVQLQNAKGIPFLSLDSTLRISEYLEALKSGKKINSKTPIDFVARKIDEAKESIREARLAAEFATLNLDEVTGIVNDAEAVLHSAEYYWHKLQALKAWTLLGEGINIEANKKLFIKFLAASVTDYEKLSSVTEKTYVSMSDVPAWHPVRFKKTPYHWKDLIPLYKKELNIYKEEMDVKRSQDFYKPNFNNLAGILYRDAGFVNPKGAHPATGIDFNWDNDKEAGRNWSVQWFGYLKAPIKGDFNIILSADRDVKLRIGDRFIELNSAPTHEIVEKFQFEKGAFYPIEVHYDHQGGEGGFIKLEWSSEGYPREVIQKNYLFHSEAQQYETKFLDRLIEEMK